MAGREDTASQWPRTRYANGPLTFSRKKLASQIQVPLGGFLLPRIKEEGGCEPLWSPEVLVKASVTVLTLAVVAMES